MVVLEQVGHLQVFMIDRIVRLNQFVRLLVMKVASGTPDSRTYLGQEADRLATRWLPLARHEIRRCACFKRRAATCMMRA